MLNTTKTDTAAVSALEIARAKRDAALEAMQECAKRVRKTPDGHPLAEIYEMQLDQAFEEYGIAEDDLREIRDGYRHTYPHPAASKHPADRYANVILPLGLNRK